MKPDIHALSRPQGGVIHMSKKRLDEEEKKQRAKRDAEYERLTGNKIRGVGEPYIERYDHPSY